MDVRGLVALVTGASSGVGRATAELLAARGVTVCVHGRDGAALAELAARLHGIPLAVDLAQPDGSRVLAERALAAAGRVDLLVANAGLGYAGDLSTMDSDRIRELVAVNLTAPMELTRLLLPDLLARRHGALVYVTSIAGRTGVAGEAVYSATKAGLDAFAESIRLELRGSGVRVGVLVPGVIETPFFERRGRPYARRTPRPLPAGLAATRLVRLIESGAAEAYLPRWLSLPVAIRSVLPGVYRSLAARLGES
jgi:short-subunit dehydrogenase